MMSEIKTKPTNKSVSEFLDSVTPQQRKDDSKKLLETLSEVTGENAVMWGPSIVGYGKYHYKYDSGHEGDMCRIGFSPRKANMVIYLLPGFSKHQKLLEKLGKHKTSVSCLYINRLEDIDLGVLKLLIKKSLDEMNVLYPLAQAHD